MSVATTATRLPLRSWCSRCVTSIPLSSLSPQGVPGAQGAKRSRGHPSNGGFRPAAGRAHTRRRAPASVGGFRVDAPPVLRWAALKAVRVCSDGRGVSLRGAPTRLTRPLIPLVLSALLALAGSGAARQGSATAAAVGDCTPGSNWGTVRSDLAAQVVGLVNQHRAGLGLGGLSEAGSLTAAATWKARHMAFYGYMGHDDPAPPVARSVASRLAACGYTAGWGENIAYGQPSPTAVMQAWLSSPGHKANIERASFRAIGVGVAAAANGTLYWAQVFGTSPSGGSPAAPPPAPPPPPAQPPPPAPPPPATAPRQAAAAPNPTAPRPTAPRPTAPKPTAPRPTPPATPPAPPKQASTPAPAAPATPRGPSPASEPQRFPHLEASRLLEWGPRPRAGRTFTGRLMVHEPDTRKRVESGRVTCNAHTAGRRVWVGIHRFRNGFVVCRWHVPQIARHHRLIGTIQVFSEGRRTARWFSRIVR
jgi:uncharacterized protein YkwD